MSKNIREIVGFTFTQQGSNPENWHQRASAFNQAANLLYDKDFCSIPYYYNAGLSIELIIKAITIAKSKPLKTNHSLITLAKNADINLTPNQELTLELLSEIIVWSGRYPTPKGEEVWDKYFDEILEKHIIRKKNGIHYSTMINNERFPTIENYSKIWLVLDNAYSNTKI